MRQKYVPETGGDERSAGLRRALVRGLIVASVFVAALIILGVMFDYLPGYLATYGLDR